MSRSTRLDWSRSMALEWSWYRIDPETWQDVAPLTRVTGASVSYDADSEVLCSARIDMDEAWQGEMWARCYLDAWQGGKGERICVATLLCKPPTRTIESTVVTYSSDGYGPLAALRETRVGYGWFASAGSPSLRIAASVAREYGVAPVVEPDASHTLVEPWVAGDSDTALTVVSSLAAKADHEVWSDPYGNTCLVPATRVSALAPVVTLGDGAGDGMLLSGVTETSDAYDVPNVVEVVRTSETGAVLAVAVNDNPASSASTASRGRRVVARLVDPDELAAGCTQEDANRLAEKVLADRSCVVRTVEYERGFDPRIECGDCVRLLMPERGLDVTGRVVRQDFACDTTATVRETLVTQERL